MPKKLLKKRMLSQRPSATTNAESSSSSERRQPKGLGSVIKKAWKARENAYCPYSGFKVGSALRSKATGKVYVGCNVENAALPTGLCAERGAVCAAVAAEGPGIEFDEIVVVTGADTPTQPCGPCR
jgi:cytidine deaminase